MAAPAKQNVRRGIAIDWKDSVVLLKHKPLTICNRCVNRRWQHGMYWAPDACAHEISGYSPITGELQMTHLNCEALNDGNCRFYRRKLALDLAPQAG